VYIVFICVIQVVVVFYLITWYCRLHHKLDSMIVWLSFFLQKIGPLISPCEPAIELCKSNFVFASDYCRANVYDVVLKEKYIEQW